MASARRPARAPISSSSRADLPCRRHCRSAIQPTLPTVYVRPRRSREAGRSERNSRVISQWRIVLGKQFSLVSSDSFKLGAYRADPTVPAKGGIVLIQEIFGVNQHIRAVCDRLVGEGYAALAPALFDHLSPRLACRLYPDP